jgi:hypothetical protein
MEETEEGLAKAAAAREEIRSKKRKLDEKVRKLWKCGTKYYNLWFSLHGRSEVL